MPVRISIKFFCNLCDSFLQDGSKAVYKGNPSSASHNILLKPHKVQRGPIKKILWDHGRLPSMKDNILELLHNFLNQFLSGGYNGMSSGIKIIFYLCFAFFLLCFLIVILVDVNQMHASFDAVNPWGYWKGASHNSEQWYCYFLRGCSVCHFVSISQVFDFPGEIVVWTFYILWWI